MTQQPRTGALVWGALLLALCLWVAQRTFFPALISDLSLVILIVLGLGTLLLAVGVTVALRERNRHEE